MTKNQIDFANYVEGRRHSLATEKETHRSNRAGEIETNRSNLARERETHRSNKAQERLSSKTLKESKRHNVASEKATIFYNDETKRHNLATERETNRSNVAQESLAHDRNNIAIITAQISADATKYAAGLSAQAARDSAAISAAASRFASEMNRLNTQETNASKEQIANLDRLSNEAIQAAKRLNDAIIASNDHNAQIARNQIEELKAQIQREYNEGRLTREGFMTVQELLESAAKNSKVVK